MNQERLPLKWRSMNCQMKVKLIGAFLSVSCILLILQMSPRDFIDAELVFYNQKCEYIDKDLTATPWPKIIHQIWIGKNVPKKYEEFRESCRTLNPNYKYKLWNGTELENLIRDHYPWFMETLNSYPYLIQKADVGRLFLIYHFGGIYLDIDIKCRVPIETVKYSPILGNPNCHTILAETQPLGLTNNMLISKPKTPFMHFVIHRLLETQGSHFTAYLTIMFSTGPFFLYRTFMAYPCKNHIHIMSQHDHSHVYFSHAPTSSWSTWETPTLRFLDKHGRMLLQALTIIAAIILILRSCRLFNSR